MLRSRTGLFTGHTGLPDGSRGSAWVGRDRSRCAPGRADLSVLSTGDGSVPPHFGTCPTHSRPLPVRFGKPRRDTPGHLA
ncbi:hypothetical protein BQ8420_23105 [Nocardiopsis sp. JB363]|nr:hypothetical protein BQ8420_23105 [Nocardiopsis sp. JB363]